MKRPSTTKGWPVLALGLTGCAGSAPPSASPTQGVEPMPSLTTARSPSVVHRPREPDPPAPIACTGPREHSRVLALDWPMSERMALVDGLETGRVVARYEGCTLELLPGCRIPEIRYDYVPMPSQQYELAIGPEPALRISNLPRLAAAESAASSPSEVSAVIATSGRYEAMPIDLRRASRAGDCEGSTHVISTIDVGRVLHSTLGHEPRNYDCNLSEPTAVAPPPLCRETWSVRLTALDPLVPIGQPCPAPLHWNGLFCGHVPRIEVSATCTIAWPGHPACSSAWPNVPLSRPDGQSGLFPERLTDAMVDAAMARIQDAIDGCAARFDAPPEARVRVLLHVDGPTGRVIVAQAIGRYAQTPLGECTAQAAANARFETTRTPRQKVSPVLRPR